MGWRDLKKLYEEEDDSNSLPVNKPDQISGIEREEIPAYANGWEKVFPPGDVKTNPPYWRKDGVMIPDKEWIKKYHEPLNER